MLNVRRWFVVVVRVRIYFSTLKFDVIQRPYMDTIRAIYMNLSALIYVHSMFQLVYDVPAGIVLVFLIKWKDYFMKSSLESMLW